MAVLSDLALLDTPPEAVFEHIVTLAQMLARTPIALVSLVDNDRQWFKARLGLEVAETPRNQAFCSHAIRQDEVMWIADAAIDPRFAENPLVTGEPNIRMYAGAPLTVRGRKIGTVCVIDRSPRVFDQAIAEGLSTLAGLAAHLCEYRLAIGEVDDARQQVAAANVAKTRFLANMSHELRTPLNGVIGVASVLNRSELNPAQREMVGIVRSSAETLTALLDDMLDISKVEAGKFELELSAFRLDEIIQQSVDLFRLRAHEKGLALTFSGATGKTYIGDGARIRQIVSNLISNAVKFTDSGSVEVQVHAEPGSDGERLRVEVSDTGPGFSEEMKGRLFERFEQEDASLTRRHGGSGLGLAISRDLADLMGGTLHAVPSPGRGACFVLTIELQTIQAADAQLPESFTERVEAPLRGASVLVADDNATNRRLLELILETVGARVTIVNDGLEAVEAFATSDFDMVLMDVQMPVMDGLEAIRRIRAFEQSRGGARTPINTLSAHAMPEHIQLALAAGADDHLTKPITSEALLEALAAGLEAKAAYLLPAQLAERAAIRG